MGNKPAQGPAGVPGARCGSSSAALGSRVSTERGQARTCSCSCFGISHRETLLCAHAPALGQTEQLCPLQSWALPPPHPSGGPLAPLQPKFLPQVPTEPPSPTQRSPSHSGDEFAGSACHSPQPLAGGGWGRFFPLKEPSGHSPGRIQRERS